MKNLEKLQTYLPLGYLYLVILGIIKESIHFFQLGINILKYSTLMDVLLSPIADLMSHPLIFVLFVLFIGSYYGFLKYVYNSKNEKLFQNFMGKNKRKEDFTIHDFYQKVVSIMIFTMASFFVGIGFAEGRFEANKAMDNDLKYNYKLNYNSGESEVVHLVDNNSVYYFYFSKGNKNIKIAPVGTVKNLEIIKNKRLE